MVFFVHFLVGFAALCAFAVVAGIRLLVLRFAPSSRRPARQRLETVEPFVKPAVVPAPLVVPAPPVVVAAPVVAPILAAPAPLRLLPRLPTPSVLIDFDQDDPTLLESEPTRVWAPPSAPDLRIAR